MEIDLQLNKNEWNNFITTIDSDGSFLQSWEWGEFQQDLGRDIFRISIKIDKKISAVALIIKHKLPLGQNYLYIPRGPILKDINSENFDIIFSKIKQLSIDNDSLFIRIDPAWKDDKKLKSYEFNFIGQVQPKKTLILQLNKTPEELLSLMKPKTRYNIKLAQRHEVLITEANLDSFDLFWHLMVKTCLRDGIKSHSKIYYQKQLKIPGFKLKLAWWQNKVIAGAIINDFGNTRTYVHGASDYKFRDKMAPYLLQWEMICEAQKLGLKYYDFWGADPSNSRWAGVTRFKIGFAPQQELTSYIGAYDFKLKPLFYRLYKLLK